MSHVFPRNHKASLPLIAEGDGCYLIDTQGRRYFDGSCGAAVSSLGHNNSLIINAIKKQLDTIAFAHTGFFTSEPAEKLATLLATHTPGLPQHVYFVSGGSEAIEAALKLARQYFLDKGEPSRSRIIARKQSYHGNTLGALAAGGDASRKKPFTPLLINTSHITPCYEYREKQQGESSFDFGQRVANELETEILNLGPENVMAFIAETVSGATLGAVPPVRGYFTRIRDICNRYGVLLILDEVMCGMGRTGSLFAYAQENITPDIVAIAKGLGGGYQPIGAMICSSHIYNTIGNSSGAFQHGHTYLGHPTACAAALAVVNTLLEPSLMPHIKNIGKKLSLELHNAFGQHPHIGNIRGRGLFLGLEIVKDRNTKQPFNPSLKIHAQLKKTALEAGLICYPTGGFIDGKKGDHILLAPPFIMEEKHTDEIISKLQIAFRNSPLSDGRS